MPARGAKQGPSFEPAAHRDDPSVLCLCPYYLLFMPAPWRQIRRLSGSCPLRSWEGGTGYRDSCSFAKLLGASTSIILRVTWADGEGHLGKAIIRDSKVYAWPRHAVTCSTHPLLTGCILEARVDPCLTPTSFSPPSVSWLHVLDPSVGKRGDQG